MPAKSSVKDVFANRAFKTLTMSAIDTLTFDQIQFGVGIFQGIAMIVNRVEWFPTPGTIQQLVANTDALYMAITNRDDLSDLNPTNQSVLILKTLHPVIVGAVVSELIKELPIVSDFSSLPGGGLIIPANPIHVGAMMSGGTAAGVVRVIMYFEFKTLSDAEYIELLQTIMPANI